MKLQLIGVNPCRPQCDFGQFVLCKDKNNLNCKLISGFDSALEKKTCLELIDDGFYNDVIYRLCKPNGL